MRSPRTIWKTMKTWTVWVETDDDLDLGLSLPKVDCVDLTVTNQKLQSAKTRKKKRTKR